MSVVGMLCLQCFAQDKALRPLTVGDTVPDIVFNNIINYKNTTAKLSDFKGKLVILDFWASWCGGCLEMFPKMDSLQNTFKKHLQFILVNPKKSRDDLHKIIAVKNRMDSVLTKNFELPIVSNDSIISSYFWYMALPHYIWIDRKGIVRAITSSDYVTEENIHCFINDLKIDLPVKFDTIPEAGNK